MPSKRESLEQLLDKNLSKTPDQARRENQSISSILRRFGGTGEGTDNPLPSFTEGDVPPENSLTAPISGVPLITTPIKGTPETGIPNISTPITNTPTISITDAGIPEITTPKTTTPAIAIPKSASQKATLQKK